MKALLKLKADILADAELPLVRSELDGLLGCGYEVAELSTSWLPPSFRDNACLEKLLARGSYKGAVKAFYADLDMKALHILRTKATYISDILVWSSGEAMPRELSAGLQPLEEASTVARSGMEGSDCRVWAENEDWLAHYVPSYWFLEYADYAVDSCKSPRQAGLAIRTLLQAPFALTPSIFGRRVYSEHAYTTSHFTHGLHQYKGKFFPRMARALLNAHRPQIALDPFCGSGTLQAEASTAGYSSVGLDLNPLAVNICLMKQEVLSADPDAFDAYSSQVRRDAKARYGRPLIDGLEDRTVSPKIHNSLPLELLEKLSKEDVAILSRIKDSLSREVPEPFKHILLMILSDSLKSKVRVRVGGKTAFFYSVEPNQADLLSLFQQKVSRVSTFMHFWQRLASALRMILTTPTTIEADARNWPASLPQPDLIITSPPYFPYTGISYVYTNLAAIAVLEVPDPRGLEERMIGNTLAPAQRTLGWEDAVPGVRPLIAFLESDRYRKGRIPIYLSYFEHLRLVFREIKWKSRQGCEVRFVIARSQKLYRMHTNQVLHEIDCVAIVRAIAEREGLEYRGQTEIPLFKNDKVSLFPSNQGVEVVLHLKT